MDSAMQSSKRIYGFTQARTVQVRAQPITVISYRQGTFRRRMERSNTWSGNINSALVVDPLVLGITII